MARWLREQSRQPELIVSSPAVRAHQTAGHICEGLGRRTTDLVLEPQIYGADLTDLLRVVAGLPSDVNTAMLIGHNPGVEEFVVYLVGAVALSEYQKVMPTAAIYHLELGEDWVGLAAGSGRVLAAMRPKALTKSFKTAKPRE